MKKKKVIFQNKTKGLKERILTGVIAGFIIGLIVGLIEGETIFYALRGYNESAWMLLIAAGVYAAFGIVIGLCSGIFFHFTKDILGAEEKISETAYIAAMIITGSALLYALVILNGKIEFPRFHPVSLALDIILILFFYFLWRGVSRVFEMLGRIKRSFYLAVFLIAIAGIGFLNLSIYKDFNTPPAPPQKHLDKLNRAPVIILMLDTLRADYLGCYGKEKNVSPTIDRLAANGLLFEKAYASSSWTIPSHFSMMTGTTAGAVRQEFSIAEKSYTLPERFYDLGYKTAMISANPLLSRAVNFEEGFQLFDPSVHNLNRLNNLRIFDFLTRLKIRKPIRGSKIKLNNPAAKVTDYAIDWIERNSGKPYLLFVNYMDIHDPYLPPKEYRKMFAQEYKGKITGDICGDMSEAEFIKNVVPTMTGEDWDYVKGQYMGAIRYVDDQIARIVRTLKEKNQFEDTILIVLSDHGELFGEYGLATHHLTLSDEETHIPLIFHYPAKIKNPQRVTTLARIIDVYPTLKELTGFRMHEKFFWEGQPLIDKDGNPTEGALYCGAALYENAYKASVLGPAFKRNLFSYRTPGWKYLYPEKNKRVKWSEVKEDIFRHEQIKERLIPAGAQPTEETDLEAVKTMLRNLLSEWRKSIAAGKTPLGKNIESDEYRQKMLITGYNEPY